MDGLATTYSDRIMLGNQVSSRAYQFARGHRQRNHEYRELETFWRNDDVPFVHDNTDSGIEHIPWPQSIHISTYKISTYIPR